jgi:hypothetical protein
MVEIYLHPLVKQYPELEEYLMILRLELGLEEELVNDGGSRRRNTYC